MNLQKLRALLWKEFREDARLYAAVALVLLLLDLWVVVRPGMFRSALIPWMFAPVLGATFFFGLGASLQREWRENTIQFAFSLPIPRGWTLATKLFVHYAFFTVSVFAFALLTWKLMDQYVAYVVMHELYGPGTALEEARNLIAKYQARNKPMAYVRLGAILALLGSLLAGAASIDGLLGHLVSRFRGLVVFLGFVAYGWGLFRFMDLWTDLVPLAAGQTDLLASGIGFAVGMALYGLVWTAALVALFAWRAEV